MITPLVNQFCIHKGQFSPRQEVQRVTLGGKYWRNSRMMNQQNFQGSRTKVWQQNKVNMRIINQQFALIYYIEPQEEQFNRRSIQQRKYSYLHKKQQQALIGVEPLCNVQYYYNFPYKIVQNLIPWQELASHSVLTQVQREISDAESRLDHLKAENMLIKREIESLLSIFKDSSIKCGIIEVPSNEIQEKQLKEKLQKKIRQLQLKLRREKNIGSSESKNPSDKQQANPSKMKRAAKVINKNKTLNLKLLKEQSMKRLDSDEVSDEEEIKLDKQHQFGPKSSQFYRPEVEFVRLQYRGFIWPNLHDFKDTYIRDMNAKSKGSLYYVKICQRNIYVRCNKCQSFHLRFNYQMKRGKEINIAFSKGTTYHSGIRH